MKKQFYIQAVILLITFFCYCKKEPSLITYDQAIQNPILDTFWMSNPNDTSTKTPMVMHSINTILGAQLPAFTAPLLTGDTIDQQYFEGKISVINFWFIGCKPCEAEMPGFNMLIEKYKSKPVNFLAITRNSIADVNEFFVEHPFRADQVPFGHEIAEKVFQVKWGYPTTIVADEKQQIIAAFHGGPDDSTAVKVIQDELTPIIDEALAKM